MQAFITGGERGQAVLPETDRGAEGRRGQEHQAEPPAFLERRSRLSARASRGPASLGARPLALAKNNSCRIGESDPRRRAVAASGFAVPPPSTDR